MYNGLKIKSLIENKGISQKDVYKKAGMSKPSIDYFFDRNIEISDPSLSITGNGNKIQHGDGNIMIETQAKEIEHLQQLLAEKERTIQILLNQNK